MNRIRMTLNFFGIIFIAMMHSNEAAGRKENMSAAVVDKDGREERIDYVVIRRNVFGEASKALGEAIIKQFKLDVNYGLTSEDIEAQPGSRSELVESTIPGYKFSFTQGLVDDSGKQFTRTGARTATAAPSSALPLPAAAHARSATAPVAPATPVYAGAGASHSSGLPANISMVSRPTFEKVEQGFFDEFGAEDEFVFYFKRTGEYGELSKAMAQVILSKFNLADTYGLQVSDIETGPASRYSAVTSTMPGYKFSFKQGLVDAGGKSFNRKGMREEALKVAATPPMYAAAARPSCSYAPSPAKAVARPAQGAAAPAPSRATRVAANNQQILKTVQAQDYTADEIGELVGLLLNLADQRR